MRKDQLWARGWKPAGRLADELHSEMLLVVVHALYETKNWREETHQNAGQRRYEGMQRLRQTREAQGFGMIVAPLGPYP